ncbi:hypothetical protein [Streptomyces sp. NPDC015125]|uniref:hypothetical protein n=1 Tax=Streptomyces sp. NPDC015125 TaxID=3364938 RepID=UPI0036F74D9D
MPNPDIETATHVLRSEARRRDEQSDALGRLHHAHGAAAGATVLAALGVLDTQIEELNRIKGQAKDVSDYPGPPVGTWPKGTA